MSQYDENSKNPSNMQSLKESRNIMPSLIVILFVIVLEFAVQVSEREKNAKTVEDEKIKEENKRLARCSDVAYSIRNESECKSNGYRFYYEDTRGVDYSHPNLEYIFESRIFEICRAEGYIK